MLALSFLPVYRYSPVSNCFLCLCEKKKGRRKNAWRERMPLAVAFGEPVGVPCLRQRSCRVRLLLSRGARLAAKRTIRRF